MLVDCVSGGTKVLSFCFWRLGFFLAALASVFPSFFLSKSPNYYAIAFSGLCVVLYDVDFGFCFPSTAVLFFSADGGIDQNDSMIILHPLSSDSQRSVNCLSEFSVERTVSKDHVSCWHGLKEERINFFRSS